MSTKNHPVRVKASGDAWTVEHPTLDDPTSYDAFDSAHNVAKNLALELDTSVEFDHPKNVNLRRLSA